MSGLAELVPVTTWLTGAGLCAAAFIGGALNTGAVGGSLISFLALTYLAGLDPLIANGTNIALIAFAFAPILFTPRVREIAHALSGRGMESAVAYNMLAGKVFGVLALTVVTVHTFTALTPWLLGSASVLLAISPWLRRLVAARQRGRHRSGARLHSHRAAPGSAYLLVGAVGLYAGFFAGATGALLFAILALITDWTVHKINDVKNLVGVITTIIGVVPLVALGATPTAPPVAWGWVALLAVPTLLGGWAGLTLAARLPRRALLAVVVTTAATGAVFLAIRG